MFIKIIIILLLLIVVVSLLTGRGPQLRVTRQSHARPGMRKLTMRIAMVLLALAAAVTVVHLSGCSRPGERFHATVIDDAKFGRIATLDTLTDHTGRRFASADYLGKAVVIFFGYTHCPDICPTTLSAMQEAMRLLGPEGGLADRVQVLFVTVDPERDTAELLAGYVPWFDPRFIGLYGDVQATLAAAKEFHVFYAKVKGDTALGYSIDHTATSYAYDPQGRLRLLIRQDETPQNIADDLRKLLAVK
jgi:protein SCO1/2